MRLFYFSLIFLAGTAFAEPFDKVRSELKSRAGADVSWNDSAAAERTHIAVQKMLGQPLTIASAVQIALLNNGGLQETFEDVGIAQADVIEAVTLPNPSIDFEAMLPNVAPFGQKYIWLVAEDFVQILMLPLKKKVAQEHLEMAELKVADQALELVENVKSAYVKVQAAQQLLARLKMIGDANAASLDLAQKQFQAGNVTDLALLQVQENYSEGRLDVAQAESDLHDHREEFNRLLGLWGPQTQWQIVADLAPVPPDDLSRRGLESLAVAQRLDLQAAERKLSSVVTALGLTKTYRWLPVLDFGYSGETETDGQLIQGPAIRLEVPIFNQGQGRIAKGQSELRRAEDRVADLAVDIRSQVRELSDRLLSLQERARFYHDEILPTRQQIVKKSLLEYNAMQIGPDQLFLEKSAEFSAERSYLETLRDYWTTRASLERVVGGTLHPKQPALALKEKKS